MKRGAQTEGPFTLAVRAYRRFTSSVWLFPGVGALLLLLLTALQISGTSIGAYYPIFYGGAAHNANIIANHPQAVRSDEWLVNTQLTIEQKVAGYPRVNPNVAGGRDMSLVGDVPYKDWSIFFRPQNLIFFVLPLTYAFAFKWWLLLYLTMVGTYFLILRFLPQRRLFAVLLAVAFGCSPFIFWWYQTITIAPIFYGCFLLLLGMRIIKNEPLPFLGRFSRYTASLYSLLLGYLVACFALVLYPPFQIPIGIVVLATLIALLLQKYGLGKNLVSRSAYISYAVFAIGGIVGTAVVVAFIETRLPAFKTIAHTVYPGNRLSAGGGTPLFELFNSYLQPQLERTSHALHYYTNQSEASNFMLFLPFLYVPGWFLIYLTRRRLGKIDWPLLAIQACSTLFLANMFIAGLQPLYKLTLLDRVPHGRLFIGLGIVGFLQLLLILRSIEKLNLPKRPLTFLAFLYCIPCLICLAITGRYIRDSYPLFIHVTYWIAFLALVFTAILFCFLSRHLLAGAWLLLLLSVGSVYNIHPLNIGLAPLYPQNNVLQAIDAVSRPGARWITLDDTYFENFPALANRDSISGLQPYPNLAFWKQVAGPHYAYVYNRYAHTVFNSSSDFKGPLALMGPDSFQIKFACTPFVEGNAQFALSTSLIHDSCTTLLRTVSYPNAILYLYKIT